MTGLLALASRAGAGANETAIERRLRVLEETVREQAEKIQGRAGEIERLRSELDQSKPLGEATRKEAEETQERTTTSATAARSSSLSEWTRRTTLFGDFRFRFEGLYHQPTTQGKAVTADNRERLRARLGLRFAPTDEVAATVRLATGNPDSPISRDVTLSGEFTPKDINLDWAFLTLTPGETVGIRAGLVTLVGGKFPNPIFRPDELVFDDDLAPEGTYETLAPLDHPLGGLDQIKLHLLQWSVQQVATGGSGWMIGGQVNPQAHLGRVQLEAGVGQYYWLEPDLIAQALNTNSSLVNTNQVITETVSGTQQITGYVGAFNQTNVSGAMSIPRVFLGRPLRLFGDYVYNWQAESARSGVLGGLLLGETRVRGDWALTAFYEYLEQQAVLSVFSASDFGVGGTNQQGPVLSIGYQLLDPFTVEARGYFTNYIDTPRGSTNPTQTRLQLDALLRF